MRRTMRLTLLASTVLAAAGCGSGSECDHACAPAGATQCVGDVLQVCAAGDDGCRQWQDLMDCAGTGARCEVLAAGDATCLTTCENACPAADDKRCQGDVLQICAEDDSGCRAWEDVWDCAQSGMRCDDSGDTVQCAGTCSDTCPAAGDSRCLGSLVQRCTEGPGGCLAWTDEQDCADSDRQCDDSGDEAGCTEGCIDPCVELGARRCSPGDDAIQVCADAGGDCLRWVVEQDCAGADPPATCVSMGGQLLCQPRCAHGCSLSERDTARCADNAVEVCSLGDEGCYRWQIDADCDLNGLVCIQDQEAGTAACRDPADHPERTSILNGSFELDPDTTPAASLSHWRSELVLEADDLGSDTRVSAGHALHEAQSLHVLLRAENEGGDAHGKVTQRLTTAQPRSSSASHFSLWASDDVADEMQNPNYRLELRLVFEDAANAVPVLLRCERAGYFGCWDIDQEPVGPFDEYRQQAAGSGGLNWKRYTVAVPEDIDRSNFVVQIWYRIWFSESLGPVESELYLDRVFFSDAAGNPS